MSWNFSCIFFKHGYLTGADPGEGGRLVHDSYADPPPPPLFQNPVSAPVSEIRLQGSVSQNFNIGLSFCFM